MNSSIIKVSSLYKRVVHIFCNNNFDDYWSLWNPAYTHINAFMDKKFSTIYNEIENGRYNYYDYVSSMIYESIWSKKSISSDKLGQCGVDKLNDMLSDKRYNEDKLIIKNINSEIGFKDIYDYFSINENGESIMTGLIFKNIVTTSIMFRNLDEILTDDFYQHFIFKKGARQVKLEKSLLAIKLLKTKPKN